MDINLLSKMIGELILDNESVALPGIGSFVAVEMPASFSDRGYSINPPYRKLTFVSDKEDDSLLSGLYARSNGIELEAARLILVKFLKEVKKDLNKDQMVLFPGLGKLRMTNDGNLFFVEDEDLDIYADGFGLQTVSLKTSSKAGISNVIAEAEPVAAVPEPEPESEVQPDTVPEPEPETVPESEPEIEVVPEPEAPAVPKKVEESRYAARSVYQENAGLGTGVKIIIGILAAAFICLVIIAVVGRLAPNFIDRFLYTPEEIRIINF